MLINAVPREEMSEDLQSVYDHLAATAGDTKFAQAGANSPGVFDWWTNSFYEQLYRSGRVDPRINEIVRMRLSKAHGCALCNRLNTYDSLAIGIDQATIDAIGIWPDEPDAEMLTERRARGDRLRRPDDHPEHGGAPGPRALRRSCAGTSTTARSSSWGS